MSRFYYYFLLLICSFWAGFGQNNLGHYVEKDPAFYQKDFERIYELCKTSRVDSTHRICIVFLKDYGIRNELKKVNAFCNSFKVRCRKDNRPDLVIRIDIIQLANTARILNYTDAQINDAFKKIFTKCYVQDHFSAALECFYEKAMLFNRRKNDFEALKTLFFCEKFALKYNLQTDLCFQRVMHEIGYKLLSLEQSNLAISAFKQSLATKNSQPMDSMVALNGIGIGYQKLKDFNRSNTYFQQAKICAFQAKNNIFETVINGNIALNKFSLGELQLAKNFASLDKKVSLENKLWSNCVGSMALLAQIELKNNNLVGAKILLDSINSLATHLDHDDFLSHRRQFETNYLYYSAVKNFEKSLFYYQKFNETDKLFRDYSNKDKVSLLEVRASATLLDVEMEKIETEKQIKNLLVYLGFSTIAIVMLVVFFFFLKSIKKAELEKIKVQELNLVQQAEIVSLKKALYAQLEIIKLSQSEHIDKNDEIEALKAFNLSKKEQWQSFRTLFVSTFPDFEQKIAALKLEFTNADNRLLMLHKLGLSNKDIALALFISPDGVKKANYRLYKKLGINSNQELLKLL